VTFYYDTGVPIGADATAPYAVQWVTTGLDGARTLYVRVFDNANNYLESATVAITVDNTAPSAATITSPLVGVYVKGIIWINATGTDAIGVKNVTFYRDSGILIDTDTTTPYAIQWNTGGLDGARSLYVRVFDNANNFLESSTVAITVDNTNPSAATVTAPTAGAYVRGTIWINATATDAIGIKNVTFYYDTAIPIGMDATSPYAVQWNTAIGDGAHTLYVRVFDYANNYLDSATVAITVDNTAPNAASITSPLAGVYIKGIIWINATGTDAIGIKNVTFYRDSGISIGSDATAPYAFQWNTAGLDGARSLYIRVFDNANNFLDSGTVAITVDNTNPSVASVTAPTAGAYVRGTIWINATATDAIGIKNVTFYRDTGFLIGTDTTAPYAVQWNTAIGDGAHSIYVRAFDNANNYLDSTSRSVTVDNTQPSSAIVISPSTGAYIKGTIWINATAADATSGIKNVTFYYDTAVPIGTDAT
jgi:hypothetical protein